AEVDYLIEVGGKVTPIEVKAGPAGRLRSLRLLLERYPQAAPGVVVSGAAYATLPEQQLMFVPLYSAGAVAAAS
ncbi:MAG: nuclease, partial [Actinobacteria bacterium]|nr:nuclease [Actinomycetota bacterium]